MENIITGLEAYDALKLATNNLPIGSIFSINKRDLQEFTPKDIPSRGFDRFIADKASSDLLIGSCLAELSDSIGIQLAVSGQAPMLPGSDNQSPTK